VDRASWQSLFPDLGVDEPATRQVMEGARVAR
jgi:hypothetical protein